jgi:hypothetical protein
VLARVAVDLPAPTADPARVRDLTKEILQRPEFRPPRRSLLQAVWHWLATQLGKLLSQVFGGSGAPWAAVVVVVVVAAVVVGLVLMTARRRGRGGGRHRDPVVVFRGHGPARSPGEWRADAAAHEAAGRWRDALRCRYRALVAELAGRGLVEEIPGRTTGEYRQDVNIVVPAAGPAFDGATDLFEQAWYGDGATGSDEQATFDDLARRVLIPVGAGAATWDLPRRDGT